MQLFEHPELLGMLVDPYLRPLYDALYDLLEPDKVDKMLEKNVIEVAPLAFMRGRTLNDAFIIMDEAQNTTVEQMKMFLTRMGANSKAVITGDITRSIYRIHASRAWWTRSMCSTGWRGFTSATLRIRTWCVMRWCSGLCGRMRAPSRNSRSCRWVRASRSAWASRRGKSGRKRMGRMGCMGLSRNKRRPRIAWGELTGIPGPKIGTWDARRFYGKL